ncbi:MAG: MBL fold metallo-hydrolase [Lentisphaeria bacterium]|nr:MBL fold metallo-hydrolase [Lentisphaeria bacterium]
MEKEMYQVAQTGALQVNTVFLPLGDTLYIIDPGGDAGMITRKAKEFKKEHVKILLTHGHFDHIGAIPQLMDSLGVEQVYLHPEDVALYNSPANGYPPYCPHPENLPETTWPLNDSRITVRHCPGHTPGGVIYYVPEYKTVFSGDSLFAECIGRTDFPGGDLKTLLNAIQETLYTLPDETVVIAGHEEETSIGHEKKFNPYVKGE